jgi:cell division protein ZapE
VAASVTLADLSMPKNVRLTFTPPPRFGRTSFEGYNPQHPSQHRARDEVREFAASVKEPRRKRPWPFSRAPREGRGLYIDGGFGVGKTHLLSAAYHEAAVRHKAYLSFQELVYLIGVLGMEGAKAKFGALRLLCIDEFELDDPGNTLIVKAFLAQAFAAGCWVLTTSNTPPDAQGQGRFNAEDFKREIQSIAERFTVLAIEGPDYRKRARLASLYSPRTLDALGRLDADPQPRLELGWEALMSTLRSHHPIRYRALLEPVGSVYLTDVRVIDNQNDALRFVHFIDKLYDLRVRLRASGEVALHELFDASYRHSAYAKKHERCLSRLSELLEEALPDGFDPTAIVPRGTLSPGVAR